MRKNLSGVSSTARLQAAFSAGCAAYHAGTRGAFGGNPHAFGATHEEYRLAQEWARGYAGAREAARFWSTLAHLGTLSAGRLPEAA